MKLIFPKKNSFARWRSCYGVTVATRFRIYNAKTTSVDISNIKQVVEMGVLSDEWKNESVGLVKKYVR